jgi:hypothetical protein
MRKEGPAIAIFGLWGRMPSCARVVNPRRLRRLTIGAQVINLPHPFWNRDCYNSFQKLKSKQSGSELFFSGSAVDRRLMSFFQNLLVGKEIDSVHVDSEVTYIMLNDGTCVTIQGMVIVEPGRVLNIVKRAS